MQPTLRRTGAERREQIARTALRIVGEQGLTSLTTATLAAEVGVTTGALYRHFATFEDILIETVRHAVAEIDATFPDPTLPPLDRLLALAGNRVRLLRNDAGLAWLLGAEQAYLTLPEVAVNRLRDVVQRSRRFLLDALREGAADGTIRDDIEPPVLLVTVTGTIHAMVGSGRTVRQSSRRKGPATQRVLEALALLLKPSPAAPSPAARSAAGAGRRPRLTKEPE